MTCTECGREWPVDDREEEICLECQIELAREVTPELLGDWDDRETIQPGDYRYYQPRGEEP